MTRDELLYALTTERFGPLPTLLRERLPAVERRRRVLLDGPDEGWLPPPARREIAADVLAMAGRGWSPGQIAALLCVSVGEVVRVLARYGRVADDEGEVAS